MNYAEARRLSDGSGWHFTVRNDDRIWTHSCCRTQVPATEDDVARLDWIYNGRLKVGDPIDGPAHAPHATREEAEECYRQWCLAKVDETLEFADDVFTDWQGCEAVVTPAIEADCPECGYGGRGHRIGCPRGRDVRCDVPTKGGARYNADHWPEHRALCPEHRTKEVVLAQVVIGTRSAYS